jgi:DNA polymerase-3 subunit epsilon
MLRDLHTIEHLETTSEIEAAVLENRAIAELKPLYNKKSKPPRALYWVRLTDERFPRLSIARKPNESRLVLGPFRNRRSAEEVMHALWDATPIRRCTAPGKGCGFAQLGRAVCPCDGSVTEGEYAAIVEEVVDGVARPATLLPATAERIGRLAVSQRFEDAALVRDRWSTLTRAIERTRIWDAFQNAGRIEIATGDGVSLLIVNGRMVTAWRTEHGRPLTLVDQAGSSAHPPSLAASDEAMLLWRWLSGGTAQVVSSDGSLALPAWDVPSLTSARPTPTTARAPNRTSIATNKLTNSSPNKRSVAT